jgi:transposase-like protein
MLVVETIAKIRRAYFVQRKAIKEICRELNVSRKVVRKVCAAARRSSSTDAAGSLNRRSGRGERISIGCWR